MRRTQAPGHRAPELTDCRIACTNNTPKDHAKSAKSDSLPAASGLSRYVFNTVGLFGPRCLRSRTILNCYMLLQFDLDTRATARMVCVTRGQGPQATPASNPSLAIPDQDQLATDGSGASRPSLACRCSLSAERTICCRTVREFRVRIPSANSKHAFRASHQRGSHVSYRTTSVDRIDQPLARTMAANRNCVDARHSIGHKTCCRPG